MEINMKEIIKMVKKKEKEYYFIVMEINMWDFIKMEQKREKESCIIIIMKIINYLKVNCKLKKTNLILFYI